MHDRLPAGMRGRLLRETTRSHRGVFLFILVAAALPFVLLGAKSVLDLLRGFVDPSLFAIACVGFAAAPVFASPFGLMWALARRRLGKLLATAAPRRGTVTRVRRQGNHGLKVIEVEIDGEPRGGWFSVTGLPGVAVGSPVELLVGDDRVRFVALTKLGAAVGHFGAHP